MASAPTRPCGLRHRGGLGGCVCLRGFYTGLDAVAGVAAGTAVEHAGEATSVGPVKRPLYDTGEVLGQAGAYALIAAIAATALALLPKHGIRILPGTIVLLAAGWSFVGSHIFWPRGVWTMVGFALGFALLAWGAGECLYRRGRPAFPPPSGDHGTGG